MKDGVGTLSCELSVETQIFSLKQGNVVALAQRMIDLSWREKKGKGRRRQKKFLLELLIISEGGRRGVRRRMSVRGSKKLTTI